MITNNGVLPSLHSNCHHQIIYANINFKLVFSPPYERVVWYYDRGDHDSIRQSISNINWDRIFFDKNVNLQVEMFNEYILNIFKNFIPIYEINDKDPSCVTEAIKERIKMKTLLYKR